MQSIIFTARFAELRPRVNKFCKDYFDNFTKDKNHYAKQDGYHHRLIAALVAADYLQKVAKEQNNMGLLEFYAAKKQECENERKSILKRKIW